MYYSVNKEDIFLDQLINTSAPGKGPVVAPERIGNAVVRTSEGKVYFMFGFGQGYSLFPVLVNGTVLKSSPEPLPAKLSTLELLDPLQLGVKLKWS